jgi:energy-coupling factor transporter transmembrane protein EcfT
LATGRWAWCGSNAPEPSLSTSARQATATAIECRGFGAYPDRTYVKTVTFRPRSLWLPLLFTLFTVALIVLERV